MALRFALLIVSLNCADGLKLLQTSHAKLPPGGQAKECDDDQYLAEAVSSDTCDETGATGVATIADVAPNTACDVALTGAMQAYDAANAKTLSELTVIAENCCRTSGYYVLAGLHGTCGGFSIKKDTGVVIFYKKIANTANAAGVATDCEITALETGTHWFSTLLKTQPITLQTQSGAGDGANARALAIGKVCDANGIKTGVTSAMVLATYAKICGAPCTYFTKPATGCWECGGYVIANPAALCTEPNFYVPTVCKLIDATGTQVAFAGGSMAKAFNDPRVVNLAGETFDIMAVGTMSMLRASTTAGVSALSIAATVDRAGTRCGATYIQNISIEGTWVQEKFGSSKLEVRATAAVPKPESLQVSLDGETWKRPVEMNSWQSYGETVTVRPQRLQLQIKKIILDVGADSHRVVEVGTKTRRFANFLNLNIKGADSLIAAGLRISGLLSGDNHDEITKLPSGCETSESSKRKAKLLSYVSASSESTEEH